MMVQDHDGICGLSSSLAEPRKWPDVRDGFIKTGAFWKGKGLAWDWCLYGVGKEGMEDLSLEEQQGLGFLIWETGGQSHR